ncbi:aminopeptidase N [Flavobacterium fontis]|uniref:Aminopeptidase N n=1 Tax=Flavobacterium fontis TaxID=1124188 RepID=A0A1M5E0X4_9FLAO|nr:M1 family metallopeptidase [Flavobacterium fontis]SHF72883.1 aminopeptidase N [Flavobacterium fontis]
MRFYSLFLSLFVAGSVWSQSLVAVDFTDLKATVFPNFETKEVSGHCQFTFIVNAPTDTLRIDAKNMRFSLMMLNGKAVEYNANARQLLLYTGFKKGKNRLSFSYTARPKQALYFVGTADDYQIWTQGQGKYTSHWLPSFDDVNEKLTFSLSVTTLEDEVANSNRLIAISNGELVKKESFRAIQEGKVYTTWSYQMKKPMASYLVMLAVGNFDQKIASSASGIPLESYLQPKDADKWTTTYWHNERIFNFLEKEIGVKYPWRIYRQIPVRDFLYAGMENTTSTLFAQDYVVDSVAVNDKNYCNVNAHELAHQWFGDLITAQSGKHHWLQEGFATYYALLAEKELFGEDYFYYQLYRNANLIKAAAKNDTVPILHEKASSLSYYQKGAWALHYLRDQVGKKVFDKIVKTYLKKYALKNVVTADFLAVVQRYSDFDTEAFQQRWLESAKYPEADINQCLAKSAMVQALVQLQKERSLPLESKLSRYTTLLQSEAFWPLKAEVLFQLKGQPLAQTEALYRLALERGNLEVLTAVSELLTDIPESLKTSYETLLHAPSYVVRGNALVHLLKRFPHDRMRFFEIAKDWRGANDLGLRIDYLGAYLVLMPETNPDYASLKAELIDFTSPKYESVTRIPALQQAVSLFPQENEVLKNLVNATQHPKWQLVKYARDTIRKLIKQETFRERFTALIPELPTDAQSELQRLLK